MFRRTRLPVTVLRTFWVLAVVWYELLVFFYHVDKCSWPDDAFTPSEPDFSNERFHKLSPHHVLLVADPQILDRHSYPGRPHLLTLVSQWVVDLNLRKSWRAALRMQPDVVVFLGDMMDNGRYAISDSEYEAYYQRFKSIFKLDPSIPVYYIPGNHDTGLGPSSTFSPEARSRYISHFGPLNRVVSIANHTVVLLDAPTFVDEDYLRTGSSRSYSQWDPIKGGTAEFIKAFPKHHDRSGPVVLFSHVPLSRPDGTSCGPLRERGTIRRGVGLGYQNTLGKHATSFLLDSIQPSVIFSGDDHDYCEYVHIMDPPDGGRTGVREVTVKSISMAMGIRRPGFQLLSLVPPSSGVRKLHADAPCLLPDQLGIYLSAYIPLLVLSLLILLISNVLRVRTSPQQPRPRESLTRAEDGENSGISSAASPNREIRARLEADMDSEDQFDGTEFSEKMASSSPLPPPVSAFTSPTSIRSHSSLSWSFELWGRRRRITIGPDSCMTLGQNLVSSVSSCGTQTQRTHRGLIGGFVHDVLHVVGFPLGMFALIAIWMFNDG